MLSYNPLKSAPPCPTPELGKEAHSTQAEWTRYQDSVNRRLQTPRRSSTFSSTKYGSGQPADSTHFYPKESMSLENQMNHSINSSAFFDDQASALQERADAAKAKAKERAKEEAAIARASAAAANPREALSDALKAWLRAVLELRPRRDCLVDKTVARGVSLALRLRARLA